MSHELNSVESEAWGQRYPWELKSQKYWGKVWVIQGEKSGSSGGSDVDGVSQKSLMTLGLSTIHSHACTPHTHTQCLMRVPSAPHSSGYSYKPHCGLALTVNHLFASSPALG